MEKLNDITTIIRRYIENVEDERNAGNVLRFEYKEELNQEMLLLNLKEHERNSLPKIENTIEQIKKRLIAVSDQEDESQGVVLRLFYTNLSPSGKNPMIAMGIYPVNTNSVEYTIRPPEIDLTSWYSRGRLILEDESATKKDPILLDRSDFEKINLLFFKRNPFDLAKRYYQNFPENEYLSKLSGLQKSTLEQNVISDILKWAKGEKKSLDFYIFKQPWFGRFIENHQFGEEYEELYKIYKEWRKYNSKK